MSTSEQLVRSARFEVSQARKERDRLDVDLGDAEDRLVAAESMLERAREVRDTLKARKEDVETWLEDAKTRLDERERAMASAMGVGSVS